MQYVERLRATIESLLFITNEPLSIQELVDLTEFDEEDIRDAISWLEDDYGDGSKGIGILQLAGGYLMGVKEAYLPYVEKLYKPQISVLSVAALETVAIIAYKQPITRGEIELIRGVKVDKIIHNLLSKGLIEEKGRKDSPGKPMQYGTTKQFLQYFQINSLEELPIQPPLLQSFEEADALTEEEWKEYL